MARRASKHPTELELEILKILWREGPLPVARVRDKLAGFRDLTYPSVSTIMNIMVDKGYVSRAKPGANYTYRPRVTEAATTRKMLKDIVDRAFHGSRTAAVVKLLESSKLGEEEIEKIQALLDRQAGGKDR